MFIYFKFFSINNSLHPLTRHRIDQCIQPLNKSVLRHFIQHLALPSHPSAVHFKHLLYSSACQMKNSCVCIFTSHSNRPLPATDKTATSWPTVIKLGSVVGASVPVCRHGGSKAAALLLTGMYFH